MPFPSHRAVYIDIKKLRVGSGRASIYRTRHSHPQPKQYLAPASCILIWLQLNHAVGLHFSSRIPSSHWIKNSPPAKRRAASMCTTHPASITYYDLLDVAEILSSTSEIFGMMTTTADGPYIIVDTDEDLTNGNCQCGVFPSMQSGSIPRTRFMTITPVIVSWRNPVISLQCRFSFFVIRDLRKARLCAQRDLSHGVEGLRNLQPASSAEPLIPLFNRITNLNSGS